MQNMVETELFPHAMEASKHQKVRAQAHKWSKMQGLRT